MSLLTLSSVSKFYGRVAAVDNVSLDVAKGSRTAVVGASGSGKSSLLRLIAGFENPNTGTITLAGEPVAGDGASMPAHRRGVGYVTQDGSLFPHLTVAQNVAFGMPVKGDQRQRRIDELLEMVGLDTSVAGRRPDQLSGGQQQRIALARALAQSPRLMLLDEPFSALDSGLRGTMRRAVMDVLARASVTSILVTHDHEEALTYADQVAVLIHGRLAQFGSPHEVYWTPRTAEIARALGDAIILPATVANGTADTVFGSLPVGKTGAAGRSGFVMLRPEQIVVPEEAVGEGPASIAARIAAVEFAGGRSRLVLDLLPSRGDAIQGLPEAEITLWHRGPSVPEVGTVVRLIVRGSAHPIHMSDADTYGFQPGRRRCAWSRCSARLSGSYRNVAIEHDQ
jgi:iron(III) transport system ATP-binding protein